MSTHPDDKNEYSFKMPFTSSIHPHPKSETLVILQDINSSLPPSTKLPEEIILRINDEVHRPETIWESIRSVWTAAPVNEDPCHWVPISNFGYMNYETAIPLSNVRLLKHTMEYVILGVDEYRHFLDLADRTASIHRAYFHMSSADLLYRVQCFFPEVYISRSDGYKAVWAAGIRHNQTGFGLAFSEHKGGATLLLDLNPGGDKTEFLRKRTREYEEKLQTFSEDSVGLLNAFIQTVDTDGDEPQFACFHPAARATRSPSSNQLRYIAVPNEMVTERVEQMDNTPYRSWSLVQVSASDLSPSSSLRSLLQDLKYDIKSRKIDPVNGTTPLTEVISSALLYYRLLCQYRTGSPHGNAIIRDDGGSDVPITSVWQMGLNHLDNHNALILFMDDRGLFDIRVNEDAGKLMDDIVSLINSLCSDECTHPYNGTVAGCVA